MKYQSVIINSQKSRLNGEELKNLLNKELNIVINPTSINTLVLNTDKNSLGIGDLEEILPWVSVKSDYEKLVIIEEAEKLTPEAQNSLLKVIEEPPEDSLVILITANSDLLLETILSRCILISENITDKVNLQLHVDLAEEFLKSDYLKKLAIIDRLAKNESRQEILIFLTEILKKIPKTISNFSKLESTKKAYLGIKKGTNVKLTLEAISILFEDDVE